MNQIENVLKIFAAATSLVCVLVFLSANGMVLFHVGGMMRSQHEYENPKDPLKGRKLRISEHRDADGKRFKSGYLELANYDRIYSGRTASFTAYARIADLLAAGEAAPTPEMLPVFVQSRAILFAKEECARLERALARECAVAHVDGQMEEGLVRISGSMHYVERASLGDLDANADWVFASVHDELAPRGKPSSLMNGAQDRLALYAKAAQKCADIRKREGNCAVTTISVRSSRGRHGAFEVDGSASFSFLVRARG